ncbi:LysE family translocator [Azoarcus sp. KH32C]|uniref:LysE family translocator n=1 Tax=Azoarcus sp. KH32C TaxID=748247 RepID=UPI0002385E06|nr:LysE family translocator [Azoarcus sp. KH32C]BAL27185.1 lysine exporter protein [Azoarcus sp. KH32C]
MLEHFQWIPFLLAITLLTMTPGVDTFMVIRNAARGGWRDGFLTSFGICCGLFVHATISAAGLSVILLGSAQAFMALKLAGALYLAWLGFQSLKSAWQAKGMRIPEVKAKEVSPWVSLREGFLSNVLNPKPIVFYMAFLPQFIDPAQSPLGQSLFMAGLHFAIANVWQGLLVVLVSRARLWLAQPRVARTLDGIAGVMLLGFGAKLASSQ